MTKANKILIVDDERKIVRAYQDHLRRKGYETDVAYDGVEALIKVREFKPDAILLDILMPEMNGLEVIRTLKKDPELKNIPVILLTNLDQKKEMVEAAKSGSFLYFVKSNTSLETLTRWVDDLFENLNKNNSSTEAHP